MASSIKNLSSAPSKAITVPASSKVAVVVSDYYFKEINQYLLDACMKTLAEHGIKEKNIKEYHVPGAFELTAGALLAARQKKYDAIVCLGCVIKGETDHDAYINHAVAQGLSNITIKYEVPVAFGLLTPNNDRQAKERAGGKHGNKGKEAALAALQMIMIWNQK
jgi:6,7-dimethyl-8-ribityllumazine synthase